MRTFDELVTRRAFLSASCAAVASTWLTVDPAKLRASLAHAARVRAAARAPAWELFTAEQAADVEAIAAQIIPTDDAPGAREARVVNFIDHSLGTWAASQRDPFVHGLDDLNRQVGERWPGTRRFAALVPERQVVLLHAVEQTPFFQTMRFATLVGMFSLPSYGGNADKVGWRLIGFEDRYTWQPPFGFYDAAAHDEK